MSKEKTKKETVEEAVEDAEAVETPEASEEVKEETPEEKLSKELETQKDMYLRLRAEYDNYRKRTQQEKLNIYADATAKAVTELLPLADSLVAAMNAQNTDADTKGIELVSNQFFACLDKLNVKAFGEIGDEFNPEIHNAVSMTENPDLGKNAVAAVFQKGFKIGDKVIRPAMVVVANCN
ncbi:MAG: nucleotide exchange factor GrpE [Ruminococcaceae bacterium]|nr:nucleotide exchange factor GrpE [Oscillospiraceae bacterium]